MTDAVECAECGTRYDSDANAFCPRCGSTSKGKAVVPALASAHVAHPRRRRAQVGGIIILVIGLLFSAQFIFTLVVPPETSEDIYSGLADVPLIANQAGGSIRLRVMNGTEPVPGLTVAVGPMEGNASETHVTSASGWANFTAPKALSNATVEFDGDNWTRLLFVPAGRRHTVLVQVDDEPGTEWTGVPATAALRAVAGFFAAVSVFMAVGGLMAVRLRGYPVAVGGAFAALLPTLFMAAATASLLGLLNVGAAIAAIVFIMRGKPFFQKPQ